MPIIHTLQGARPPLADTSTANSRGAGQLQLKCLPPLTTPLPPQTATANAGMMGLPRAYRMLGSVFGTSLILVVGVLTYWSMAVIVAGNERHRGATTYRALAQQACGRRVAALVQGAVFLFCFGFVVVYLVSAGRLQNDCANAAAATQAFATHTHAGMHARTHTHLSSPLSSPIIGRDHRRADRHAPGLQRPDLPAQRPRPAAAPRRAAGAGPGRRGAAAAAEVDRAAERVQLPWCW